MVQRNKICSYCDTAYITTQYKSKYCTSTCRVASNNAAARNKKESTRLSKAEKRIARLPVSEHWLWLSREVRRAGTVECLQGHTPETLTQLFELYNYKYKTYAYNPESRTSKFHTAHMSPVKGVHSVGCLHPHNLFIAPALANQVHSNKSYEGMGLSVSRASLKQKWLIADDTSDKDVLAKVVKYLGAVLIEYAENNKIDTSPRLSQARWINKNMPDCGFTLTQLEKKGKRELDKMRATFENKELYEMDLSSKRSIIVALDESIRLSEQLPAGTHRDNIVFFTLVLRAVGAWLSREPEQEGLSSLLERPYAAVWAPLKLREGMDASKLRDFVSFQTFQAMQGNQVDKKLVLNTLRKYLFVTDLSPDYSRSNDSIQKYHTDQYERFYKQVPTVQDAIISLGLCTKLQEYEYLEEAKLANAELAMFESFNYVCGTDEFDYSMLNIQVEEDYQPNPSNPNLRRFIEPIYVDF